MNGKIIIVGVIYRRPNTDFDGFMTELNFIIDSITSYNKTIYIMGDFNLDLLKLNSCSWVRRFVDSFHGKNLFNVIVKSTRVTNVSSTLLDHIWTNNYDNSIYLHILYGHISDHFPIVSYFNGSDVVNQNKLLNNGNNDNNKVRYRQINDQNIAEFKYSLSDVDWNLVMLSDNPNVAYDNFALIFETLF